jgi:hypothetical protein
MTVPPVVVMFALLGVAEVTVALKTAVSPQSAELGPLMAIVAAYWNASPSAMLAAPVCAHQVIIGACARVLHGAHCCNGQRVLERYSLRDAGACDLRKQRIIHGIHARVLGGP